MNYQANDMQTSNIENKGNGQFTITPLPIETQIAPVYGMMVADVNGDGNLDVLLTGNDYGMEPYSGRHDAFNGLCLKGDGKGSFTTVPLQQSGFFVKGDAKGLATIHTAKNEDLILSTQNQDSLKVFVQATTDHNSSNRWISLLPGDAYADIVYKNGTKRRMEFYYGSTYLSQSTRKIKWDAGIAKMMITNFRGVKRTL